MTLDDFRAVRSVLDPDDFAGRDSDEPDPPPTDLISPEAWRSITLLPDDVAIRTTNWLGGVIGWLSKLQSDWVDLIGWTEDNIYTAMVDVIDEWDAALYNAVHGYYRQSIACLRNVLEVVTFGAYCQICSPAQVFAEWRAGTRESSFGQACAELARAPVVQMLNAHTATGLFDKPSGAFRDSYRRISLHTHSRPGWTNGDLWRSNGPIYTPEALRTTVALYEETFAACMILVKLCRPAFDMPDRVYELFDAADTNSAADIIAAYLVLFPQTGQPTPAT
jgi:hypothetical protein